MKLKKFFKPLVTVSALSFMLMGCADDSSNSGGSTTPPPTAESVFSNFLTGFQSAPAKNAKTPVEFTTNTATKPNLTVAKGEEVQYLVSLDNVMAVYYATFGIKGTSTTLLTETGSDITLSDGTKIKNYAKVDTASETTNVPLTLTNGTSSLYTGMFALMTEQEVKDLDTALGELDKEVEASKPTEGDVTTPDLTKIQAATVQKVVDLINGKMYKVAYNSPAQSIQDAFAAAQPLTLANGMAFNVNDGSAYEIAAGGLSYEGANPAIADTKVVVFLDEFKNKLNGVTASSEDTVKGEDTLSTNGNLGITTDTASSNANTKKITYTPATEVVAGAKVTYVAILDNTDAINSNTEGDAFKVLNGKITAGATKAEVEAALKELGTIYKVDYTVGTYQSLIDAFKANEAVKAAVAGANKLDTSLKYTSTDVTYDNAKYLYCLYETGSIKLNTLGSQDVSADVITGYVNGGAGAGSSATKEIVFNGDSATEPGTYYAYCTNVVNSQYTATGNTVYEKLADFLGKLTATEGGLGLQVFSHEKTAEQ